MRARLLEANRRTEDTTKPRRLEPNSVKPGFFYDIHADTTDSALKISRLN